MEIVRFENVSKRFGNLIAVDSLTLSIGEGEIFGFLGPNGAGKTTTIKMLVGLLAPSSGDIFVGGINIKKEPEKAKSIIGYIPDSPYIYDKLTGREFLYLLASLRSLEGNSVSSRIEQLFELFGVGDWGDSYAGEYSHGMKQKIVMAGA
ncbi:MAG: ABC transporter ATP-binding protein, partial [bacterium]